MRHNILTFERAFALIGASAEDCAHVSFPLGVHPVAHLGDDARHIGGAASQLVPQSIRLAVEYVGAERLHKRKIG